MDDPRSTIQVVQYSHKIKGFNHFLFNELDNLIETKIISF